MEKMIGAKQPAMLKRLMAEAPDWDMATLYLKGKSPILMVPQVKLELSGDILKMICTTMHPQPMSEQDAQKQFTMETYLDMKELYAIDYYVEKRIESAPGIVKGMGIVKD